MTTIPRRVCARAGILVLALTATVSGAFAQVRVPGDYHSNGGGDDLAIGTPFYAVNGVTGTGLVALVFSNGFALDVASSKYLYQPSSPANAHFGFSLSAVDLGGNAALAIGVPGWPNAGIQHGGAVAIRYGSWTGPSATANSVFWTQDVLPGVSEENATFGFALSR